MIAAATPTPARTNMQTAQLRSVELAGPAGKLEALLNEGSPDAPFAALVCHPHPKGGGSLHNKVVYHAMKVLNDPSWGFGFPVLRFNFRGTGLSQGAHDGVREADDVLAASGWLENEYNLPVVVAGFSFGAAMALSACCGQDQSSGTSTSVRALAALGLPTFAEGRAYSYRCLAHCSVPKLFLSGERDEYAPDDRLAQVTASASEPKKLLFVPGGDHFFTGQLAQMQQMLAQWLKEELE
jgi:uncharacterized protein